MAASRSQALMQVGATSATTRPSITAHGSCWRWSGCSRNAGVNSCWARLRGADRLDDAPRLEGVVRRREPARRPAWASAAGR